VIRFTEQETRRVDSVRRYAGRTKNGKLVYVADIAFGALPSSGMSVVAHGLDIGTIVRVEATATDGTTTFSF
jgi:hypothetical protein